MPPIEMFYMVSTTRRTERQLKPQHEGNEMGSVNEIYGSNAEYLKGSDFQGKPPVKVTVGEVRVQEFPARDDSPAKSKLVMSFNGKDKEWVMGPTVAREFAGFYGDNYTDWGGIEIELFAMQTPMGPGIRFRPVSPPKQPELPANDPSQVADTSAAPAPGEPPF